MSTGIYETLGNPDVHPPRTLRAAMDWDTTKALFPSALAFLGSMLVLFFTLRRQGALDDFRDQRSLRDRKWDRIRGTFEIVLTASRAAGTVADEWDRSLDGKTVPEHREKLTQMLSEAYANVNLAHTRLLLETDTQAVVEHLDKVLRTFRQLQLLRNERPSLGAELPYEQIRATKKEVDDNINELHRLMRIKLYELESPVRPPGLLSRPKWLHRPRRKSTIGLER